MLLLGTNCSAKVKGERVASMAYREGDIDEGGVEARVVLFECPQCTGPMLVRQYVVDWEMDEWGHDIPVYETGERIFPVERRVHPKVPEPIRRSLEEALRCLDHSCYVAAAIMC